MAYNSIMKSSVLITKYNDRSFKYECNNHDDLMLYIKQYPNACEVIGENLQFIKPVFDVDAYNDDINVDEVKSDINMIFPNKDIYYAKRGARDTKRGVKYSYRFYVDDVKIFSYIIKDLIKKYQLDKKPIYDLSIYDKNKILFLPYTSKKVDCDAPILTPVGCDVFKCCASYIEDDFEDWSLKYLEQKNGEKLLQQINDYCEKNKDLIKKIENADEEDDDDEEERNARKSDAFYNIVKKHVKALSNERAGDYNDWLEIILCIINIGEKYEWEDKNILELCDIFSRKNVNSYNEKDNKKKIYSLMGSDRTNKVGYKRLLERLKEDDPLYYKLNIVPSYYELKADFEKEYSIINNPVFIYRTPFIPRVITENLDNAEINQHLKPSDVSFQAANLFYNKRKTNTDKKGNVTYSYEKKPFYKDWLQDPHRLTFEGIVFRPSGMPDEMNKYYKNLFTGFKADKVDITDYNDYLNIQPILDHIKLVYCAGVEEHYQYVLKWFAKIIQDPENKPQVGLVFYSKEHGTGRNTFTTFFMNEVMGCELTATARKVERIFGRFNSILAKCMFLVIEEASGDVKKYMEDFKNLITEPTFTIEKKNIDAGTYKNFVNPIMLTNNRDILDIDDKDRRFAIFESSSCKKGDTNYFNNLYACIKNKKNAGLFIKYLREEVDASWTPMEFQQNRPITKAYRKQQSVNAKNYIKFISHITCDDFILLGDDKYYWKKYKGRLTTRILHSTLYRYYKDMCEYYKYTAYQYDKFLDNITQEGTGITQIIDGHSRNKKLFFDKNMILQWVEIFRNSNDENLPVVNDEDTDDDDEDTDDDI